MDILKEKVRVDLPGTLFANGFFDSYCQDQGPVPFRIQNPPSLPFNGGQGDLYYGFESELVPTTV
jgi:hypothetical protein